MVFMQDPLPANLRTAVRHDIHVGVWGEEEGGVVRGLSETLI
jgi:hypothetical protein